MEKKNSKLLPPLPFNGDLERKELQQKSNEEADPSLSGSLRYRFDLTDIEKKDAVVVSASAALMKVFSEKAKISIVVLDRDPEMRKWVKRILSDVYDGKITLKMW